MNRALAAAVVATVALCVRPGIPWRSVAAWGPPPLYTAANPENEWRRIWAPLPEPMDDQVNRRLLELEQRQQPPAVTRQDLPAPVIIYQTTTTPPPIIIYRRDSPYVGSSGMVGHSSALTVY